MLRLTTNGNGSAIAAPRVLNGRGIAHLRNDKKRRAVLAAELADGRTIVQLSVGQLASLLNVSRSYVDIARKLTPEMRQAVLAGRGNGAFRAFAARVIVPSKVEILSEESLAALAHHVGPDRWLAAACRADL